MNRRTLGAVLFAAVVFFIQFSLLAAPSQDRESREKDPGNVDRESGCRKMIHLLEKDSGRGSVPPSLLGSELTAENKSVKPADSKNTARRRLEWLGEIAFTTDHFISTEYALTKDGITYSLVIYSGGEWDWKVTGSSNDADASKSGPKFRVLVGKLIEEHISPQYIYLERGLEPNEFPRFKDDGQSSETPVLLIKDKETLNLRGVGDLKLVPRGQELFLFQNSPWGHR